MSAAPRWWLPVLLAAVAVQPALSYLLMGVRLPDGFSIGVVVSSVVLGLAVLLWIPYRRAGHWSAWESAFLAALLGTWAFTMWSSTETDNVFSATVAWLPIAAILIWAKRPDTVVVRTAVLIFTWVLVVGLLGYLALQLVSVVPHRVPDTPGSDYELRAYWLPLADLLGLPGRWAGPFGHPNIVSPIGAYLVVLGFGQRRWTRVAFVGSGVLVLLLAGTRSSLVAAVAGILVVLVARLGWLRPGRPRRVVLVVAAAAVAAALTLFLVLRPGLTGRVSMWPGFLDLWDADPVRGIGDTGITLAILSGALPPWASHGHNLLLDPLVRYGVPALLLVIAVLLTAGVSTWRAAVDRAGVGLGILATIVVGGLTETPLDWRYLNVMSAILLVSVLLAGSQRGTSSADSARNTPHGEAVSSAPC